MNDDIAVREATVPDADEIAPLFDEYRQFYGQPTDLPRARDFLRARLEHEDSRILLAASVTDGEAVGFVQIYPSFSSVRCRPMWILNDLFVAENARRRGVARALLDAAAEMASAEHIAFIELATQHTNESAQRLYESCGYKLEQFRMYTLAVS